jgi:membrane protein YqaA with SNARE-associated domain
MSQATQEQVEIPAAIEGDADAGGEHTGGLRAALSSKQVVMRWLGGALVVAITLAGVWLALNPEMVQGFERLGYLGAFLISLIASATIVLPAPGLAIIIGLGRALDPVTLGIVAGVGSAIGELTGYYVGREGRFLVPASQRQRFEQLHRLTGRYGAALLFVLAAFPFPFFDFAGIIAGMLRMNLYAFLAAVGLGKSVKYIVLIWLGERSIWLLLYLLQEILTSSTP